MFQSERRRFLKGIGLLGGLSLLPAAVLACAPKTEPTPELPSEPIKNQITVAPAGGDFQKLSDALNQITDASASNRYTISLYGRIDETVTLVAKSYVDVVGYGADIVVNSGRNIPGADFNMECPPKRIPVVMLDWNLKNGGRYGKESTFSREDHQQAARS